LFLLQIILGIITAHYGVEGNSFYGIPLAKYFTLYCYPDNGTYSWVFSWIATAWLAAGLYISPAVSGIEPKGRD